MPTDATLTISKKDRLFRMLTGMNFDPADFNWSDKTQEEWDGLAAHKFIVSELKYKRWDYSFSFGYYGVIACPGQDRKIEKWTHQDNWEYQEQRFEEWLRRLRNEINAPNLWASVGQEKILSNAVSSPTLNNLPFDQVEHELIHGKLDEIKAFVYQAQQLDAAQSKFVEQEFAYLKEASGRMGRKDWLTLLAGGFMSMIVGLALEPATARGLLALAGSAFQSLWGVTQAYLH
jgi:hypothetical protein